MENKKQYFGIDISKDVFDVVDEQKNHYQFENSEKGFRLFAKKLDAASHCVMESTGYYHYLLASFLNDNGFNVSVVNPLSVKRFIQMKLGRVKTDKSDAEMICLYGQQVELILWKGHSKNHLECLQVIRLSASYIKQTTSLKNKIHAEKTLGTPSKLVIGSLKRSLRTLRKELSLLEEKLVEMVKDNNRELLSNIESIPGIGRKTAMMLIVLTDGFRNFENGGQLCSFAGLTPIIRESGSSVRGKARISKMGNKMLRNLLFMCSFTACKHNRACREIYTRIIAKGKSKKLALIAVCNKLLKQAFAIAKSGVIYNDEFKSINPLFK